MKKISLYMIAALMLLSFMPSQLRAEANTVSTEKNKATESAEAKLLIDRLHEIKAMDKSTLSFQEKKQLRKEVRTLKTQIAQLSGGVYLSAGVIVVILLILLLVL